MAAVEKPKLLFVVTEDWYFLSHRIALARLAIENNFEVHLATRVTDSAERLAAEGIHVHPLSWKRGSSNPASAARALIELVRLCRRIRPEIVHYVAMKPIVIGAFCQAFAPKAYVVNAVSGLGSVYSHTSLHTRILRALVNTVLRTLLKRQTGVVVVQNDDDGAFFKEQGFLPSDGVTVVPGAGIDTDLFRPVPEPEGDEIVATVVARMLWDKGIGETVEGARLLKARGVSARIRLVGPPDPENPNTVDTETLKAWHSEGIVDWMGPRSDIGAVWAESHIGMLASYREGLPRALLEAAACGRPLVTTDTSGCRMLVRDGMDGFIVPVGDAVALADAIETLATDPALRAEYGANARARTVATFSDRVINAAMLELYRGALDKMSGASAQTT